MTPDELEQWLRNHPSPAVKLTAVPDHEALGVLMDAGRAIVWKAEKDGEVYAAPTTLSRQRPERDARRNVVQYERDIGNGYWSLDSMVEPLHKAIDPHLVAVLAEIGGIKTAKYERFGNRHIPSPVILYGGRQAWPPEGFAIEPRKVGKRNRRISVPDMVPTGDGPCTVCRDAPLSAVTFCLACQRWGLDHLLTRERAAEQAGAGTIKFRPRAKRGKTG